VWLICGAILIVALAVIAVSLLKPRQDLLGTNSVGARTATAIVPANKPLCVPQLHVPAGTGQVQFMLDTRTEPRPALEVALHEADKPIIRGTSSGSALGGHHPYTIVIPTQPTHPESVLAEVCLTAKAQVFAWGTAAPEAIPAPTIGGVPIPFHVSVWFLGPPGAQRSIVSQMGEMFRRGSLFNAGFVGVWTYWVLFLVLFPVLAYGAVRLLATADVERHRRVPLQLLVGVIGFCVAASWAIITPAFQSPDESEHFAYVQYFAETGRAVETVQTKRPPYSESEALALNAVYHTSVIERAETRPPWLVTETQAYYKGFKSLDNRSDRSDGGGYHPAISPHTPAYYALLAPAYLLTRNDSVFTQLFAMRLTSALMGALIAVIAVLLVSELLPGRRALAVAAGLLVAFEPMFAYTAGAVNNDNGVNLAAALLIYLVIRALRRGLTAWLAVAIGATMVAAPILKGTGYELYPPAILALVLAMFRRHSKGNWLALGVLAVTVFVLQTGWGDLAQSFHRSAFTTPGGVTPGLTLEAFHKPKTYLSWMIRFMLPFKAFFVNHNWTVIHWPFFNVYIERGFASFGWYAIYFRKWVYLTIVAVLGAALVLAGRVLWREEGVLRRRWPEIFVLALVPIAVIGAVEANFEPSLAVIPLEGVPEEGRYAFPSIVAVAALFIGASHGFGRRRAAVVAAGAVACMIGFALASQLLTLSAFFT
jgi:4-amino-4-deoxy-L-arabinose transferase-like glycosyltransferase